MKLAGYWMMQAIWCVSEGQEWLPLVVAADGSERRFDGKHAMTLATSAFHGAPGSVLIVDGYHSRVDGAADAMLARFRNDAVVVPYHTVDADGGFALFAPTGKAAAIVELEAGVRGHPKAALWDRFMRR
jgi:hypothetical protein